MKKARSKTARKPATKRTPRMTKAQAIAVFAELPEHRQLMLLRKLARAVGDKKMMERVEEEAKRRKATKGGAA